MIQTDDYKNHEGKVDWKALREARVEAGEICQTCFEHFHLFIGRKRSCEDCLKLEQEENEVETASIVRCPFCKHKKPIDGEMDAYTIYEEGSHLLTCDECDEDFEIRTKVQFSFISPKLTEREA